MDLCTHERSSLQHEHDGMPKLVSVPAGNDSMTVKAKPTDPIAVRRKYHVILVAVNRAAQSARSVAAR